MKDERGSTLLAVECGLGKVVLGCWQRLRCRCLNWAEAANPFLVSLPVEESRMPRVWINYGSDFGSVFR